MFQIPLDRQHIFTATQSARLWMRFR